MRDEGATITNIRISTLQYLNCRHDGTNCIAIVALATHLCFQSLKFWLLYIICCPPPKVWRIHREWTSMLRACCLLVLPSPQRRKELQMRKVRKQSSGPISRHHQNRYAYIYTSHNYQLLLTKTQLAKAGFFFAPTTSCPDNAICFLCEKGLDGWEESDDPIREHLNYSPTCGWAVNVAIEQATESGTHKEEDPMSAEMLEARKWTFAGRWPHEGKRGWTCKTQKVNKTNAGEHN